MRKLLILSMAVAVGVTFGITASVDANLGGNKVNNDSGEYDTIEAYREAWANATKNELANKNWVEEMNSRAPTGNTDNKRPEGATTPRTASVEEKDNVTEKNKNDEGEVCTVETFDVKIEKDKYGRVIKKTKTGITVTENGETYDGGKTVTAFGYKGSRQDLVVSKTTGSDNKKENGTTVMKTLDFKANGQAGDQLILSKNSEKGVNGLVKNGITYDSNGVEDDYSGTSIKNATSVSQLENKLGSLASGADVGKLWDILNADNPTDILWTYN